MVIYIGLYRICLARTHPMGVASRADASPYCSARADIFLNRSGEIRKKLASSAFLGLAQEQVDAINALWHDFQ
jgi:hypothetical protein